MQENCLRYLKKLFQTSTGVISNDRTARVLLECVGAEYHSRRHAQSGQPGRALALEGTARSPGARAACRPFRSLGGGRVFPTAAQHVREPRYPAQRYDVVASL